MNGRNIKYIIGIDEAGRGPLAGPFSIGAVCLPRGHYFLRKRIKDSKQLSSKERKSWMTILETGKKSKEFDWAHVFVSPKVIDQRGLSYAVKVSLSRLLKKLKTDAKNVEILLDGGLKAPSAYTYQRTIIKGDEKKSVIALASIIAKVRRDIYMERIAKRFPKYQFEIHKGYGTALHRQKIKMYGPSVIHRKTFLRSVLTNIKI